MGVVYLAQSFVNRQGIGLRNTLIGQQLRECLAIIKLNLARGADRGGSNGCSDSSASTGQSLYRAWIDQFEPNVLGGGGTTEASSTAFGPLCA